jgi:hypothetical protein
MAFAGRNRQSSRAALAAAYLVLFIFLLSELRCTRFGCVSRTGFTTPFEREQDGGVTGPSAGSEEQGGIELKAMGWWPQGSEDAGPFGVAEKEMEGERERGGRRPAGGMQGELDEGEAGFEVYGGGK